MLKIMLAVAFLFYPIPFSISQQVDRILVNSPYNNGIVFEYAFASIPEEEMIQQELIDCFISEMKATGLFTNIEVKLEQSDSAQQINVYITPTWDPEVERFTIDSFVLDNFDILDEKELSRKLRAKGLKKGALLLRYPPLKINSMLKDAMNEIGQSNPEAEERLEEKLSQLSYRIKVIAPRQTELTIYSGYKPLCRH